MERNLNKEKASVIINWTTNWFQCPKFFEKKEKKNENKFVKKREY